MKKLFFFLTAVLPALFFACSHDGGSSYDALRPVPIHAAPGSRVYVHGNQLTGKQVVQQTWGMKGRRPDGSHSLGGGKLFADYMRDTINPTLKLLMKDVIYPVYGKESPQLEAYYLTLRDVVFERAIHIENGDTTFCGYDKEYNGPILYPTTWDTIAYVPNAQMEAAEPLVRAAYARGDYDECYRILEKAYTFIPITGAQWRKLKAANKN